MSKKISMSEKKFRKARSLAWLDGHEHGLATGYRFVSFRIGSWMLQREHGKLRVRKFTLAGTGGQCLLAPPLTDGKMPCVLYNLGGPLANLITALLCVLGMPFHWARTRRRSVRCGCS